MKKEYIIIILIVVFLLYTKPTKKNDMIDEENISPLDAKTYLDASNFNNIMKKRGITNRYARWAIMCIIGKESGFKPLQENCYNDTANSRIRTHFSRLENASDSFINTLKSDCKKFFSYVYEFGAGNRQGYPDGYTYRGRGLNQLTHRANYQKYGDAIKVNLVDNPELMLNLDIAMAVAVQFMINGGKSTRGKTTLKNRLGIETINDFKNIDDAIHFFANVNAGLGRDWNGRVVTNAVRSANKQKSKFNLVSV